MYPCSLQIERAEGSEETESSDPFCAARDYSKLVAVALGICGTAGQSPNEIYTLHLTQSWTGSLENAHSQSVSGSACQPSNQFNRLAVSVGITSFFEEEQHCPSRDG